MAKKKTSTRKLAPRNLQQDEARPDDLGIDPGQVGPDAGGQSGDTQGLPRSAGESSESIEELATEDRSLDAAFIDGVAEAGDHPERPVHVHERKEDRDEV
jgi:hypothetical protein